MSSYNVGAEHGIICWWNYVTCCQWWLLW